ncbi:DUF1116 domain-containing protein [Phaeobacter sp. J2-8]|uniref:DUF1116 domain-containing protein n=1 Tax=Phaeobacter sp. J2-8 TaxID=2931394 RepID=UPI001FD3DC97|nr:DUF1116 domain-containing protein [Phaeobacter sp. J2-8]MCJ7872294.1 DUF1116 domain-containing protein [Phaeobacter sp. J2-8]
MMKSTDSTPSNTSAHDRFLAVSPYWQGMERADVALGISGQKVLHAGPPFARGELTDPIRNSAACAAVFEGWAETLEGAFALIDAGGIEFEPAQDHACVVPLAAVVTPSMQLQAVSNAGRSGQVTYAPLNGGNGPAPRLGQASMEAIAHLHWLNESLAGVLGDILETGPINLIEIADHGLACGDDCHGATGAASAKLREYLFGEADHLPADVVRFLEGSPSIFLNLWMAATKLMISAPQGCKDSSFITAAGSNGKRFGIQVAGCPGRWFTCHATVPLGLVEKPFYTIAPLAAIGDSAVIDIMGLGAMVADRSPAQWAALEAYLPCAPATLRERLNLWPHPAFARTQQVLGLFASTVANTGISPPIALGVLDRDGKAGRIGGGIYVPLVTPFLDAIHALSEEV